MTCFIMKWFLFRAGMCFTEVVSHKLGNISEYFCIRLGSLNVKLICNDIFEYVPIFYKGAHECNGCLWLFDY